MRRTLVVLALILAACSTSEGTEVPTIPDSDDLASTTVSVETTSTTVESRLSLEQATLEFTECMRGEGVDIADVPMDAQGRPILTDVLEDLDTASIEFRGAVATCASILTRAGALDLRTDPELQAVVIDQLQKFSDCMREEGVTSFPDPVPGFTGTGSPYPLEQIPFADPAFQDAAIACQSIIGELTVGG